MAIITKEQGGSVLDVASTGLARVNDGASLVIKPTATANGTAYKILSIGNNSWYYVAGSGTGASPQFSASPGDMCWYANSASTGIWLNVSDGTAGSNWYNVSTPAGSNTGTPV